MRRGLKKGIAYLLCQLLGRHILWATQRMNVIRPQMAERDGPFILALTHLSHLEPIIASAMLRRRPIDWLSRAEFFRYRPIGAFLRTIGAICIRRQGVSANAIRCAIDRLRDGRVIGICPEGGVTHGPRSMMRGGAMKHGVCLISSRTGAPVLPCIMLGADRLNRVPPWIPFRRSRLYVAFGDSLIYPPTLKKNASRCERRAAREAMAADLSQQFQALLKETMETLGMPETFVP
jgi:1-acyl-sn-glycerol-3-phosphate acyltransferase